MSVVLPGFAREVAAALRQDDKQHLAEQVSSLVITELCACGDDFCSSFYVGDRPLGKWADEGHHDNVVVAVACGMVILDVVAGVIRYVEVLDRGDLSASLFAAIDPLEQAPGTDNR
jgi:hypothetical protein